MLGRAVVHSVRRCLSDGVGLFVLTLTHVFSPRHIDTDGENCRIADGGGFGAQLNPYRSTATSCNRMLHFC